MSRASRPMSLTVPPEIFLLVTKARMSFSDALVLSGISGRSRTRRSPPCCETAAEQPIEHGVSRAGALEDTVETFAQELSLFHTGSKLVLLQGAIEPPDHPLAISTALRCVSLAEPAYGRDVRHESNTMRARLRETGQRRRKQSRYRTVNLDGGSRPITHLRWR